MRGAAAGAASSQRAFSGSRIFLIAFHEMEVDGKYGYLFLQEHLSSDDPFTSREVKR